MRTAWPVSNRCLALASGTYVCLFGHDDLMPTAYEWAKRLAQGPSQALSMTKRMINSEWNMDLVSALEAEDE